MTSSIPECAEESSLSSGSVRYVSCHSSIQVREKFQEEIQPLKKLEEGEHQNTLCMRNHNEYLPDEHQIEGGHKITDGDEKGVGRSLVEPQSESSTAPTSSLSSCRHLMEQNGSRLVVPEIPKKPSEGMIAPELTKKPEGVVMVVGGCQISREDDTRDKTTVLEAGWLGEEQSQYKHEERFPHAEDKDRSPPVIPQEEHRSFSSEEEAEYHADRRQQEYVWQESDCMLDFALTLFRTLLAGAASPCLE